MKNDIVYISSEEELQKLIVNGCLKDRKLSFNFIVIFAVYYVQKHIVKPDQINCYVKNIIQKLRVWNDMV